MFKYNYPIFMCMINFIFSSFACSLANAVPALIIFISTKSEVLRIVLSTLTGQIILFVFLYISMSKYGYKENNTYKKISIQEMSIIIIITVPFITTIFNLTIGEFSPYALLQLMEYTIPIISMIIGYRNGFKKRNKDREKLTSTQKNFPESKLI